MNRKRKSIRLPVILAIALVIGAVALTYTLKSRLGFTPEKLFLTIEEVSTFLPPEGYPTLYGTVWRDIVRVEDEVTNVRAIMENENADMEAKLLYQFFWNFEIEKILMRTFVYDEYYGIRQVIYIHQTKEGAEEFLENLWLSMNSSGESYENLLLGDGDFYFVTPEAYPKHQVWMQLDRYTNVVSFIDKNGAIELSKIVKKKR